MICSSKFLLPMQAKKNEARDSQVSPSGQELKFFFLAKNIYMQLIFPFN